MSVRELTTPRLVLRPVAAGDLDLLLSLRNEPGILAGTATGAPLPEERMTSQLERWVALWKERQIGMWLIFLDGEPVGFVALDPIGGAYEGVDPEALEIGVVVRPDRSGSEIAGEAGLAVAVDAFARAGEPFLYATVDPENARSRAAIAKVREARLLSATDDEELYEITPGVAAPATVSPEPTL